MPLVTRLDREEVYQCKWPKEKIKDIGYKGYRAKRAELNSKDPEYCMRLSSHLVDGIPYCSRHAGTILLEKYDDQQT